jgi:hypothetical protein
LANTPVLLDSLIELILSAGFNHPVDEGVLPSSLIELDLGDKFNYPHPVGACPVAWRTSRSAVHSPAQSLQV